MREAKITKQQMEQFLKLLRTNMGSTSEHRAELTKNRMLAKAKAGYFMSAPPLGYERTKVNGLFRPTDVGISIGLIMELLAKDTIRLDLATFLLQDLIYRELGVELNKSRIEKLLTNPYYAGYVSFNGTLYTGQHKALVTPEEQRKITKKLNATGVQGRNS